MNGLRLAAAHPSRNSTILKLTTVQYASSFASGGSIEAKKKARTYFTTGGDVVKRLHGHSHVRQQTWLPWLIKL